MTRAPDRRAAAGIPAAPVAPALTLVIPFFNEAARIDQGMSTLLGTFANGVLAADATEVIGVDDGSTDGSADQARRLLSNLPRAAVIRLPTNLGKGGAVRAGVAAATGRAIAYLDVDMSVRPEQLPELVAALGRGDLAIGSRATPGATTELAQLHRSVMGRTFNHLVHLATGLQVRDTQCGFKAFPAPVARLLFHFLAVERFAFDVDLLAMGQRLGLRLVEVPVHWRHQAGSRVRPVPDTVSMLRDLLRSNVVAARLGRAPSTTVAALVVPGGPTASPSLPQQVAAAAGPRRLVVRTADGRLLVLAPMEAPGTLQPLLPRLQAALDHLPSPPGTPAGPAPGEPLAAPASTPAAPASTAAAPVSTPAARRARVAATDLTLSELLAMGPLDFRVAEIGGRQIGAAEPSETAAGRTANA